MTDTIYSHRPAAGVSVGARDIDGRLFVAFSLVNDGTSRNGFMHEDRRDTFCRSTARSILNGRIDSLIAGDETKLAMSFETPMTSRQFIAALRETFKPTPDETDNFLSDTDQFGGVDVRYRTFAREIVARLETLTNEVVANASVGV